MCQIRGYFCWKGNRADPEHSSAMIGIPAFGYAMHSPSRSATDTSAEQSGKCLSYSQQLPTHTFISVVLQKALSLPSARKINPVIVLS